jgi:hypothetical protein
MEDQHAGRVLALSVTDAIKEKRSMEHVGLVSPARLATN